MGKFGIVDELFQGNESWTTQTADTKSTTRLRDDTVKENTTATAGLKVQPGQNTDLTVPEWRRNREKPIFPKPTHGRASNIVLRGETQNANQRLVQNAFRAGAGLMSCTYSQRPDQPRMTEARPDDYRPFFKHEFVLGTIIRGIIHEQDTNGTPDPAMSQAPTKHTSAKNRDLASTAPTVPDDRHIGHGNWGPIYSENRFLIVVHNRLGDHYYAIPVYSHRGNGLAKKHHRNEYVSVADGRHPDKVEQQSVHRPLTALLKNGVDELLPKSAAWASYAVPRKYALPVAHQGRLDEESTKRLVSMYHKWTGLYESDEL